MRLRSGSVRGFLFACAVLAMASVASAQEPAPGAEAAPPESAPPPSPCERHPCGVMLPATIEATWAAIHQIVNDAGLAAPGSHEDGVLITKVSRWSKLRGAPQPALDARYRPQSLQLFIFVPPMAGPARVYVDSRLTAERVLVPELTNNFHDLPGIGEWFFARLEARLSARTYAIPADFPARQALARKLAPTGPPADRCLQRAEAVPADARPELPPSRIERTFVRPEYDERDRESLREGKVTLAGVIQEDGVVTEIEMPAPTDLSRGDAGDPGHLKQAAAVAVGLWRYHPAMLDGCPIPTPGTFPIDFRLK